MKSLIFFIAALFIISTTHAQTLEATSVSIISNTGFQQPELPAPTIVTVTNKDITIEHQKTTVQYKIMSMRNIDRFTTEFLTEGGRRIEVVYYRDMIDCVTVFEPNSTVRFFNPKWKQQND